MNIYYFIISIYGWFSWHKKDNASIAYSSKRDLIIASATCFGSFIICYSVLNARTDSTVPIWDSAVAALAWSGTWLMTKRKIENWIFLSFSNILAIPLYHYKHLEATALLTILLLAFGIIGYFQWKKLLD